MSDADIIHRAALIFASESWWKPIVGYIVTNCAKFTGRNFTNEEHDCFLAFRKLFVELFDCFICRKIGVKSSALETAFLHATEAQNGDALTIMQMLHNYADFVFFREQMIEMSTKIQRDTADRMIQVRSGLADSGEIETADLVQILEEGERVMLEAETQRKVAAFCAELRLDPEEAAPAAPPAPRASPVLAPLAAASRSPRLAVVRGSRGAGAIVKPLAPKQ
jgi:hypothetical protein